MKNIKMIYTYSYGRYEWMKNDKDMCRSASDFKYGCKAKEVVEFWRQKADKWVDRLTMEEGIVSVEMEQSEPNDHLKVYTTLFFVRDIYVGYVCLAISH